MTDVKEAASDQGFQWYAGIEGLNMNEAPKNPPMSESDEVDKELRKQLSDMMEKPHEEIVGIIQQFNGPIIGGEKPCIVDLKNLLDAFVAALSAGGPRLSNRAYLDTLRDALKLTEEGDWHDQMEMMLLSIRPFTILSKSMDQTA